MAKGGRGALVIYDATGEELGAVPVLYALRADDTVRVQPEGVLSVTRDGHATTYSVRVQCGASIHAGVVRTMGDGEEGGLRLRSAELNQGDVIRFDPFNIEIPA